MQTIQSLSSPELVYNYLRVFIQARGARVLDFRITFSPHVGMTHHVIFWTLLITRNGYPFHAFVWRFRREWVEWIQNCFVLYLQSWLSFINIVLNSFQFIAYVEKNTHSLKAAISIRLHSTKEMRNYRWKATCFTIIWIFHVILKISLTLSWLKLQW